MAAVVDTVRPLLGGLVDDRRVRRLRIEVIDGQPAAISPHADALRSAGFAEGYKGLTRER